MALFCHVAASGRPCMPPFMVMMSALLFKYEIDIFLFVAPNISNNMSATLSSSHSSCSIFSAVSTRGLPIQRISSPIRRSSRPSSQHTMRLKEISLVNDTKVSTDTSLTVVGACPLPAPVACTSPSCCSSSSGPNPNRNGGGGGEGKGKGKGKGGRNEGRGRTQ